MERCKTWLWLNIKSAFLLPTKGVLVYATSRLRQKATGSRQGLVTLYEDMEACADYTDIQVMWEMVQSSRHHSESPRIKALTRPCYRIFCFRPT